ncbi:MAG TPA: protein kinase [Gemmatimonadales bacterium]|nr:protein kinase [Gemmatimonadales bacterium]
MSATAPLSRDALAELRHELRTPVNHIVGYAEMLLEDAADPAFAARRAGLEITLAGARDALALINATLAPARTDVGEDEVLRLYESLREPRDRVSTAITALLATPDARLDASLGDDLRRILSAAERLGGPVPHPAAASPVQPPAPAPDAPRAAPPASGGNGGSDHAQPRQARILVVDDVADNREVLRRRLEREGHAVETAEHGRRALDLVAQRPYDLVLLDVLMPELDGYAVLDALKGDTATRDIPVIMLSALDELPGIVRCIEHGAEDYLHKPFDPVLLRARINASLEKKRLRDLEVEYLQQVSRVTAAATAVEAGSYRPGALSEVAARADELGQLARVFDSMVGEIKAREERLRDRVRDLRQEIEWARRDSKEFAVALDGGNLKTGDHFAQRYEILAVLGRGGMGTVYRARDQELEEEVAIKTLRPEFVSDLNLLMRFKDEIRLARRLSDPNIVRTHDFGEWSGVCFLTMEYVEGITVRELIDTRGRLGVSSALAIGTQLAHSLAVAHEHGVIHRDIKPQNMLLDDLGVLKVMDFGVARLAERSTSITEAGLVVGTPAYMPPEQLMAEAVDARSDLYAAGVVLYECLTGQPPFQAPSVMNLVAKLLTETPRPPAEVNPEVPPAFSALVLRLLAKKPEDRVQTARELEQRLQSLG